MDYKEATEWMKGNRSTCNTFFGNMQENVQAELLTAQTDSAMVQQAYWILRAHKEQLFKETP